MPRHTDGPAAGDSGALRRLVGPGPSQVGIVGALRARDVSRPTDDDMRAAATQPEPRARPAHANSASGAPDHSAPGAPDHSASGSTPVSS